MTKKQMQALYGALHTARYDARGVDRCDIIENVIERISQTRIAKSKYWREFGFDGLRVKYEDLAH